MSHPDPAIIARLASELSQAFHNGPRVSDDTGRTIRTLRDGSPEWMGDAIRAAHDNARMSPDDYRYELIEEAADVLHENDGDIDAARDNLPEPPAYNAERLRWLASHQGYRPDYVDSACEEYGIGPDTSTLDRIAIGYRAEQEDVLQQLYDALAERADDEDDETAPDTDDDDTTTEEA